MTVINLGAPAIVDGYVVGTTSGIINQGYTIGTYRPMLLDVNGNLQVAISPTSNSPDLNKLDLIYQRLDDLFNLMVNDGINTNNKLKAPRSFATSQYVFAASATPSIIFNVDSARIGGTIINDIGSTSNLYLLLGAGQSNAVSATNYTVLLIPNGYYELPYGFSGRVDGVWNGTSGNAYVTEVVNGNL